MGELEDLDAIRVESDDDDPPPPPPPVRVGRRSRSRRRSSVEAADVALALGRHRQLDGEAGARRSAAMTQALGAFGSGMTLGLGKPRSQSVIRTRDMKAELSELGYTSRESSDSDSDDNAASNTPTPQFSVHAPIAALSRVEKGAKPPPGTRFRRINLKASSRGRSASVEGMNKVFERKKGKLKAAMVLAVELEV